MKIKTMKKRVAALMLVLLCVVALMPMQTLAASKYCSFPKCNRTAKHTHCVCTKTSCQKTTKHSHGGKYYYGHYKNDGHAYHKCGATSCTRKSSHTHKKASASKHSGRHHARRSGNHH